MKLSSQSMEGKCHTTGRSNYLDMLLETLSLLALFTDAPLNLQIPGSQSLTDRTHPTRHTPMRHIIRICFLQRTLRHACII